MRNVYIVALNSTPYSTPFLPYVYGLLRVYAEADPLVAQAYTFKEPLFLMAQPAKIVEKLEQPAVLGLSCYIWNFQRHMKVARLTKARYPQTLVVAGGPQIPDRVEDFFERHPYVDVLVHGEGERPFQALLRERLATEPDWSQVPGVSFVRDGQVITTARERLELEPLARSPYLEGYLDHSIALCQALKIEYSAPWETNRGCPYSCTFCDWGSNTMSKIRQFDVERLLAEIKFFGQRRVPSVHINDANFGILPRDLDLAQRFVETRHAYGFPGSIVVNYAKNSNDRVFQISKTWADNGLLTRQGTTLSMQATNPEVLAAIKRENIGITRYQDLQQRYAQADIHTYTEVIMGLPLETRESFKRGLDVIFEMGKHDDVRIYELAILPNAPMAAPESVQRYGLQTIEKQMFTVAPNTPEDEIERIPTVIATNTLSKEEWIECAAYARLVQALHNGCYTRYLAIHLRRHYALPYHQFYDRLQQHFQARPHSVLGTVLTALQDYYVRYQQSPQLPFLDPSTASPEALVLMKTLPPGLIRPVDWAWLCVAARVEQFYAEVAQFLETLGLDLGEELAEVLRFQQDMMLRLDYDPQTGKLCRYAYDLPAYFRDGAPLEPRPVRVHFRDTHMGTVRQFPLERGSVEKFVPAAIGGVVRHFQHQWAEADTMYDSIDLMIDLPTQAVESIND